MPFTLNAPWSGVYFTLQSSGTGLVLDGNGAGEIYGLHANGGPYQRWVFEQHGSGFYKLTSKATGHVLDAKGDGEVYGNKWNGGDYQLWHADHLGGNKFRLKQKATGRSLDGNGKGSIYTLPGNDGNPYQTWKLTPASDKLKNQFIRMDLKQRDPEPNTNVSMGADRKIRNPSKATIEETVSMSIEKENTCTVGFTETLEVGAETEVSVDIGIASGSQKFSINASVGSSQETSTSEKKTYSVEQKVTVPPETGVDVTGIVKFANDWSTPMTSDFKVTGTADGTGPEHQKVLNGLELEAILKSKGFSGTVLETGNDYINVRLTGTVKASFGIETVITTKNIPV
eukprot:TRINITY_DN66831_c7_g6_i2.p1 TRINITY_DN66831_c7_g6~~TRINITY_DN66831_c7_g6_i2.p1  ORF type:complete len:355 (-),score=69.87 TRINITY_DN66831_c7_g6_i2:5-1030(-)